MRPPREPLFLARRNYRRRRFIDAIRLVPILGGLLFLIPILNMSGGGSTLWGGMYLFLSWLGLIVLSAALVRLVGPDDGSSQDEDAGGGDL